MPTKPEVIAARRAAGITDSEGFCRRCQKTKRAEEFRVDWRRQSGLNSLCRDCVGHQNREVKFGISEVEYREMRQAQNYRCAICDKPEWVVRNGRTKSLAVDHDHVTGAIRGLLCQNCNKGIGNLGDSPDRLIAAAAYLERHLGG